jgi:hypothetical protein
MTEKMNRLRATAWIIRNKRDEIECFELHSKTTTRGKEFDQFFEKEGLGQVTDMLPPLPDKPDEFLQRLKADLTKSEFKDINDEFKRLAKRRQRVEWYSLYNGPRNLRELATYLNKKTLYDMLYRRWSKTTHVANTNHLTGPTEEEVRVLGPIRTSIGST